MSNVSTAAPSAGWYPDPIGQGLTHRWWDGNGWTEQTEPANRDFEPVAPVAQPILVIAPTPVDVEPVFVPEPTPARVFTVEPTAVVADPTPAPLFAVDPTPVVVEPSRAPLYAVDPIREVAEQNPVSLFAVDSTPVTLDPAPVAHFSPAESTPAAFEPTPFAAAPSFGAEPAPAELFAAEPVTAVVEPIAPGNPVGFVPLSPTPVPMTRRELRAQVGPLTTEIAVITPEQLAAATAAATAQPTITPPAAITTPAEPRGSSQTVAIWLYAISPIWIGAIAGAIGLFLANFDARLSLGGALVAVVSFMVGLAKRDAAKLEPRGFPRTAPHILSIFPLVFLIVRAVKVGGGGIAPLLIWTLLQVCLLAATAWVLFFAPGALYPQGAALLFF